MFVFLRTDYVIYVRYEKTHSKLQIWKKKFLHFERLIVEFLEIFVSRSGRSTLKCYNKEKKTLYPENISLGENIHEFWFSYLFKNGYALMEGGKNPSRIVFLIWTTMRRLSFTKLKKFW